MQFNPPLKNGPALSATPKSKTRTELCRSIENLKSSHCFLDQTIVEELPYVGTFGFRMFDKFLRVGHRLFFDFERLGKRIFIKFEAALKVGVVGDASEFPQGFFRHCGVFSRQNYAFAERAQKIHRNLAVTAVFQPGIARGDGGGREKSVLGVRRPKEQLKPRALCP